MAILSWIWGSKEDEGDPFQNLDPSLQEFLVKQSPVKYQPGPPPTPKSQETNQQAQSSIEKPKVPPQSLFQDGRYAHLWKTYRPLHEIEDECKSDNEKLMDVLEGYKDRKFEIGKAALENCCMEQAELMDCYENGSYAEKMIMCRNKKKPFLRCYAVQTRFLKALGYLSNFDRPESVDDDIRTHADKLYNQMLDEEKAIEEAKAAGQPIPEFTTLESTFKIATNHSQPSNPVAGAVTQMDELPPLRPETMAMMKPEAQLALRRKMKDLNPIEREIEEKAAAVDLKIAVDAGDEYVRYRNKMVEDRKKRREEGKGTAFDHVSGWLGW